MKNLSIILPLTVLVIAGTAGYLNIQNAENQTKLAFETHDNRIADYFKPYDSTFRYPAELTAQQKLAILSEKVPQEEYYKMQNDVQKIDDDLRTAQNSFFVSLFSTLPMVLIPSVFVGVYSIINLEKLENWRVSA